MRTSYSQYVKMVEFMEQNGDLSKTNCGGNRGRQFIQVKWKELTKALNKDGSGDARPDLSWRKVWSDYKNNIKKKCAKINRAAEYGGPANQLILTDLERRVLQIIEDKTTLLTAIAEAEYPQADVLEELEVQKSVEPETNDEPRIDSDPLQTVGVHLDTMIHIKKEDWNKAGSSSQPTVACVETQTSSSEWNPPRKKKKINYHTLLLKILKDNEKKARENENERVRLVLELERERIRQRDKELQLQAQWLEIMKECLKTLHKIADN